MSTHIRDNAHFAKTVLMPGDPLRAKYIADTYLKNAKKVTDVRGILGYTGLNKDGKEISVMASGMGCPSIGIYSYELFSCYGVENIIRIGTCGSYQEDCHVGDVILATSASSDSNYGESFNVKGSHLSPCSDFYLLNKCYEHAKKMNLNIHVGPIFSSDTFYAEDSDSNQKFSKLGILGVEMESYALFLNAMVLHKHALCVLTVSDSLIGKKEKDLTQLERQTALKNMFDLALTMVD